MFFNISRRRFFRHRRSRFFYLIIGLFVLWILFKVKTLRRWFDAFDSRQDRLYCLLIANDPKYNEILDYQNQTWFQSCYSIQIVEYRERLTGDGGN